MATGKKDLWKSYVLRLEWKSEGMMEGESGEDEFICILWAK